MSERNIPRRAATGALALALGLAAAGCSTHKEDNSGWWSDPLGSEHYEGPQNFVVVETQRSIADGADTERAKLVGCMLIEQAGVTGVATLGTGFSLTQDGGVALTWPLQSLRYCPF